MSCSSTVLIASFLLVEFCLSFEPHRDHLSQHDHFNSFHEHNVAFDHDAFLGPQAKVFEQLSQAEAKRRLKIIVTTKIDTDEDGFVSLQELDAWIEIQRKNFMYEAVDENIAKEDTDGDGKISFMEYKIAYFGEWDPNRHKDEALKAKFDFDKKKFEAADQDKDGKMDRHEYVNFQHPEENIKMEDLALDEIIRDVDQDADGMITVEEFVGQYVDSDGVPAWVEKQREDFARLFDKNHDGLLEREEVRAWAIPDREDTMEEAKHLMEGSDENADGKLAVDEILLHFDLFVGSRATDHGETLIKHEEF